MRSSLSRIPVSSPTIGDLEEAYLLDAFKSGWVSSSGAYIDRLHHELPVALRVKHVTPVSTGTSALHLALLALGVGPGDEVVVPDLSFVAVPNAVLYVGAIPVFVDVDPAEFGMSYESVVESVTDKTKAIIVVHNYGFKAPVTDLVNFAHGLGIAVIEDCAEAMFLEVDGVMTGTEGDISTYSFFGNKVITSGEGGAVGSGSSELIARVDYLKNQSAIPGRKFEFEETGYNYRMTNLQAAILCGQLERRHSLLNDRSGVFRSLSSQLESIPGIQGISEEGLSRISPWLYHAKVDCSIRDQLIQDLAELNIETRPFFQTHSKSNRFAACDVNNFPISNAVSSSYLNLPTYAHLEMREIEFIGEAIKHTLAKY